MSRLVFLVLLQLACTYAQDSRQAGGGAYAYSDSTGKRYSGTYGLRDGQVVHSSGDFPVPFSDAAFPGYGYGYGFPDYGFPGDDFYPTYFSNLENLLQETFRSNLESQRLAIAAARKAYDLSSNQAGYFPNFATRLPQPHFPDFGRYGNYGRYGGYQYNNYEMPNFGGDGYGNSAYASAAVGPGFRQQVAAVNPPNPNSRNVNINVNRYSDSSNPSPGRGNYYRVSSKSYSTSSNINGQEVNRKGAETLVDDNGKITKYKVGD